MQFKWDGAVLMAGLLLPHRKETSSTRATSSKNTLPFGWLNLAAVVKTHCKLVRAHYVAINSAKQAVLSAAAGTTAAGTTLGTTPT